MEPTDYADMRIEIVRRELAQGALAGFGAGLTAYAARLVIAALDSFDEHMIADSYRQGFDAGEINQRLLCERDHPD